MKKHKLFICISLCILLLLCVAIFRGIGSIAKSMDGVYDDIKQIPLVDIDEVSDGVYQGSYETALVKVEVSVTVKDHKIDNIELLRHENGKGAPAEAIIPEMIKNNTSEVDGVSGATLSSEVIKAAVKNALSNGIEE